MNTAPPLPDPLPGLPGSQIRVAQNSDDDVPVVAGDLTITAEHLNPAGTVHAATVVALADTACGYGCLAILPESASGFTTVELKSNHVGTARAGQLLTVHAHAVHHGATTHVWDAEVSASLGLSR